MPQANNAATRFSNRVENYVRFRPHYPPGVLDVLKDRTGLTSESRVADVGSGTGISASLFLDNGNPVFGIEPNAEMRQAAELSLRERAEFTSIDAKAEATTLADASVDYVVCGQAFHWFDVPTSKREFARILRADGWVVLLWNARRLDSTPFLRAYEELLLNFGTDYSQIRHENVNQETLAGFYDEASYELHRVYNEQRFDYEGLRGRLLSSSYVPTADQTNYDGMLRELESIFQRYEEDGRVTVEYDTEIHLGRVD